MPLPPELYEKVKKTKTLDDLKKVHAEIAQDIKEENAVDLIATGILAASNALIHKHGKLMKGRDKAMQVMWHFVRHWLPEFAFAPLRILIYEEILYPQFEKDFTTITKEQFQWAQAQAKYLLEKHKDVKPELATHWQSIMDGKIPFGLKLADVETPAPGVDNG